MSAAPQANGNNAYATSSTQAPTATATAVGDCTSHPRRTPFPLSPISSPYATAATVDDGISVGTNTSRHRKRKHRHRSTGGGTDSPSAIADSATTINLEDYDEATEKARLATAASATMDGAIVNGATPAGERQSPSSAATAEGVFAEKSTINNHHHNNGGTVAAQVPQVYASEAGPASARARAGTPSGSLSPNNHYNNSNSKGDAAQPSAATTAESTATQHLPSYLPPLSGRGLASAGTRPPPPVAVTSGANTAAAQHSGQPPQPPQQQQQKLLLVLNGVRRASGTPGASSVNSRVGEQDITLGGMTPKLSPNAHGASSGDENAFSPQSARDVAAEEEKEETEEEPVAVPVRASPREKETSESGSGCTKLRSSGSPRSTTTSAAPPPPPQQQQQQPDTQSNTTTSVNDGATGKAMSADVTGTTAGGKLEDRAGHETHPHSGVRENSRSRLDHQQTGSSGALHAVEDYANLDGDSGSDVESDDESFVGAKPACASCCIDHSDPNSWRYQKPRANGVQRPFHLYQIIALTVFFICTVFHYTGTVAGLVYVYKDGHKDLPEVICSIAITTPLLLVFVSSWIALTFIEAGDFDGEGEMCTYCRRRTAAASKHCKACNKCASDFDHHCKWLNVCIGGKNYKLFLTYVSSALVTDFCVFAIALVSVGKWWGELSAHNVYFRVAPIITAVLMFAAAVPIGHLFLFHMMLRMRGMTTYEYIMWKREKRLSRPPRSAKKSERKLFSLSKKSKEEKEKHKAAKVEAETAGNHLDTELAKAAAAMRA